MCESQETKKTFRTYAAELARLVKYADRNELDRRTIAEKNAVLAIYGELLQKRKHTDDTDLMVEINHIINEYITIEKRDGEEPKQFDIGKIDFDVLAQEFSRQKRQNLVMRDLRELVEQRLDEMLFANPARMDYYNRYRQIIDGYNDDQNRATIEKTFADLMALANSMNDEQQRYVREGFSSDEELSMYDLLFQEDLSQQDVDKVKRVAVELLAKIKAKITELDHWTDKQETKAAVENLIRDALWEGLPECYDEEKVAEYRRKIYEYIYTRYRDIK